MFNPPQQQLGGDWNLTTHNSPQIWISPKGEQGGNTNKNELGSLI